ncbi:hypothetical protein WJX84_008180 [Apatococcus fuscideae]|uniref:Uncharacterized protein n=1 Tax=Apatococcus fuscideae TaxID=2026836 RepID=A0AAW1TEZ6_9CHLO
MTKEPDSGCAGGVGRACRATSSREQSSRLIATSRLRSTLAKATDAAPAAETYQLAALVAKVCRKGCDAWEEQLH